MAAAGNDSRASPAAREIRRLAWLMDESVRLPGGWRIGLDGLLGLIPGVGDAMGLATSGYILLRARRFGVPRIVMARMIANVLLDALIGAIPVAGDLFDFAFKANRRNIALMEQYLTDERRTRRSSWGRVLLVAAAVLASTVLVLFLAFSFIQWIWELASG